MPVLFYIRVVVEQHGREGGNDLSMRHPHPAQHIAIFNSSTEFIDNTLSKATIRYIPYNRGHHVPVKLHNNTTEDPCWHTQT